MWGKTESSQIAIGIYRISSKPGVGGRLLFFSHKKGPFVRGKAIILNIAHWKSCPKYLVLFSHWIKKWSHQINWTWAFLVLQIWFLDYFSMSDSRRQSLNNYWWVLQLPDSTSTWQGGDKRRRRWREESGGRLFEGGDYVKYFRLRGTIIRVGD